MSPVRIAVVVVAALVGSVGLALFARSVASPPKARVVVAGAVAPPSPPMTRVLVASHNLEPGDRISAGDFTWQPWPAANLNASFVTDGPAAVAAKGSMPEKLAALATEKTRDTIAGNADGAAQDFLGAIVRQPILQGEPLIRAKVVKGTDAGAMAVSLGPGMRAMSVPLTAESAAGGFILPGDHVDVVQSRKVDGPNGQQKFASGAVLRNVKVLAVDQQTKPGAKSTNQIGQTATLEVTAEQAELLALSKSQGDLTLILRSYADTAGPASAGAGPHLAQAVTIAPSIVRIYRNSQPSDVQVAR